ncbi:20083_t:CDS:2, partial [Racocetra fulgida]
PELLRIILTNNCLDEIVSHAENDKRLSDSLTIIKGRISGEAFGYESFPGTFLGLKSENSMLDSDILDLLVAFYNDTVEGFQFTKPGQISGIEQISVFPNLATSNPQEF